MESSSQRKIAGLLSLACFLTAFTLSFAAEEKSAVQNIFRYQRLTFQPGRDWATAGDFEFFYAMKEGNPAGLLRMHGEVTIKFRGQTLGVVNADQRYSILYSTYVADLDANGLDDFIIPAGVMDNQGTPGRESTIILMQYEEGKLWELHLDLPAYFPEGFLDLNGDSHFEILTRYWYKVDAFKQSLIVLAYQFNGRDLELLKTDLPAELDLPGLSRLGDPQRKKILAAIQEYVPAAPWAGESLPR